MIDRKSWGYFLVFLIAAIVLGACSKSNRSLSKGEIKSLWEQVSDKDTIRVRGIGVAPEGTKSVTQRKGLARNAALVNARYEALALLRGVKVTGGLSVGSLMEKDSRIREIANQVISGMEEVQVEWTADDGCVVLLELKRDKLEKMLAAAGVADASDSYKQIEVGSSASDLRPELAKAKVQ
jgi:hypothetical protein